MDFNQWEQWILGEPRYSGGTVCVGGHLFGRLLNWDRVLRGYSAEFFVYLM